MRSLLRLSFYLSQYLVLASPFRLQRSDWLSQNPNLGSPPFKLLSPKITTFSRTIVSLTPSHDHDSAGDTIDLLHQVTENPKRSLFFSVFMTICGASLGPFLDSYHSAFGVLQYDQPITFRLWGINIPVLTTSWWVPELFGLAGFLIGWMYIVLDNALGTDKGKTRPSPTQVLLGISAFTFQYWLSGILFYFHVSRAGILFVMAFFAATGFFVFDATKSGFLTSTATAIGGPVIEVVLLWVSSHGWDSGYHYNDTGETGYLPLWACAVYFLGGPANGNLARWIWNSLSEKQMENKSDPCPVCNDTRCVLCPNCDGLGSYTAMDGMDVECTSCIGRGFVICRTCFDRYDEDPYDIEAIRELMSRMPD